MEAACASVTVFLGNRSICSDLSPARGPGSVIMVPCRYSVSIFVRCASGFTSVTAGVSSRASSCKFVRPARGVRSATGPRPMRITSILVSPASGARFVTRVLVRVRPWSSDKPATGARSLNGGLQGITADVEVFQLGQLGYLREHGRGGLGGENNRIHPVQDEARVAEMFLRPCGKGGGVLNTVGIARINPHHDQGLMLRVPSPEEPAPDGGEHCDKRGESVRGASDITDPCAARAGKVGLRIGGIEGPAAFGAARVVSPRRL